MNEEHADLKCYVVSDLKQTIFAAYIYDVSVWQKACLCNLNAKYFKSFEEIAMNLELQYPSCCVDNCLSVVRNCNFTGYEIKGVSQEVLRECVETGNPLL